MLCPESHREHGLKGNQRSPSPAMGSSTLPMLFHSIVTNKPGDGINATVLTMKLNSREIKQSHRLLARKALNSICPTAQSSLN